MDVSWPVVQGCNVYSTDCVAKRIKNTFFNRRNCVNAWLLFYRHRHRLSLIPPETVILLNTTFCVFCFILMILFMSQSCHFLALVQKRCLHHYECHKTLQCDLVNVKMNKILLLLFLNWESHSANSDDSQWCEHFEYS